MLTPKVIDASALAAICFGEPEASSVAASLSNAALYSIALLDFELANVAWKKLKREPAQRRTLIIGLGLRTEFAITIRPIPAADVVELAIVTGLTSYDAGYLWLARSMGAELVTLDKELLRAASAGA